MQHQQGCPFLEMFWFHVLRSNLHCLFLWIRITSSLLQVEKNILEWLSFLAWFWNIPPPSKEDNHLIKSFIIDLYYFILALYCCTKMSFLFYSILYCSYISYYLLLLVLWLPISWAKVSPGTPTHLLLFFLTSMCLLCQIMIAYGQASLKTDVVQIVGNLFVSQSSSSNWYFIEWCNG